jgi:transposase
MGRKSSELSEGCKENIISLLQDGKSFVEVAGLLEIPKSTVYSVRKKFRSQGSTENTHKSGRRKLVDDRTAWRLVRQVRVDRTRGPRALSVT